MGPSRVTSAEPINVSHFSRSPGTKLTQIKCGPLRHPILCASPKLNRMACDAAICPASNPSYPVADDPGPGRLTCRTARQDLCLEELRTVPFRRSGDEKQAQGCPTVPDPAPALSRRITRRGVCRGHLYRSCQHAGIRARPRPDSRPALVFEDPRINVRYCRVCTVQAIMSLAIRPNASLKAATAAGGSTLSTFWRSSNKRDAMTLPFLSTILADNPISAAGSESSATRKRLTSIRS